LREVAAVRDFAAVLARGFGVRLARVVFGDVGVSVCFVAVSVAMVGSLVSLAC
jgi:hypothetical protein